MSELTAETAPEEAKKAILCYCVAAAFAIGIACHAFAQEVTGWDGAKVASTDLLAGETIHGKFAYFFASAVSPAGCHVAKVEGERGNMFVRRNGRRGNTYQDISHPVFSADGSGLAYAVRGIAGGFFVVNEREGPVFQAVLPDSFAFSSDGTRHAYLAKKGGRLVAVIDRVPRPQADADMDAWPERPVFSADGNGVGYLEGSNKLRKMRAVINGKPGETFDGVSPQSLKFSPDGKHFSYAANDRSKGSRWFWVTDGKRGSEFDATGVSFAFSRNGERYAHTGQRAGQWFLVVNGEPEVPIEGIVDHSLTFSPDGQRLAYAVARPDRRCYLVLDGKAGPVLDEIGVSRPVGLAVNGAAARSGASSVLFSPDSRRIAYLARIGPVKKVYLDGKPDDVELDSLADAMTFSADSKRLAYGGRRGDKSFVVADGKKGADYDGCGYISFSEDAKHYAHMALKGPRFVIVVDGRERGKYGAVPAGPVFRSDGVLEFLAAEKESLFRVEVTGL